MVYGTRPEAIKVAPLIIELRRRQWSIPVVMTGQHRGMVEQINARFGIEPTYDLDVLRKGASLSNVGARVLNSVSNLLERHRPDRVLVQGDTSTAALGALAAFYQRIPVVHLEAGLRTGDVYSPHPEEAHRRLLGSISSLHLAPTPNARGNLVREGVDDADIVVTGNTAIDALHSALRSPIRFSDDRLSVAVAEGRRILVVTAHRRESWGRRIENLMHAVHHIAAMWPDILVVVAMHGNPIVRGPVESVLGETENCLLLEPMDYFEFSHLLSACKIVLTDSGGIQEEAPSLGKPVLVMRETTERHEGIEAGTARLVGLEQATIIDAVCELLNSDDAYSAMAHATNPYGDGNAAVRAVAAMASSLGAGERCTDFDPELV